VDLHVARALLDRRRPALGRRGEALEWLAAVHDRLADDEGVGIEALVSLSAFCSALATADLSVCDLLGRQLLVELEDRVRLVHVLTANEVDDEPHLPGRLAHQPLNRMAAP